MRKESRWGLGIELLGAGAAYYIGPIIGAICAVIGLACFIPDARAWFSARGKRDNLHKF